MRAQEHHKRYMEVCIGIDFAVCGIAPYILATHFGNLVAANEWVFERQPLLRDRLCEEPNQGPEKGNQIGQLTWMGWYAVLVGKGQEWLPMLTKADVNWSTAASFAADAAAYTPITRNRGDT